MLKKLCALSLAFCFFAAAALAGPASFESLSATIELAEDMQLLEGDALTEDMHDAGIIAIIADKGGNQMVFTWQEDESLSAGDPDELTEEQLIELASELADSDDVKKAEWKEVRGTSFLSITYTDEIGDDRAVECFIADGGLYVVIIQDAEEGAPPEEATAKLISALYTIDLEIDEFDGEAAGGY